MVSIEFTDIERELMDKHRLAIFEDRLILDAQPPIDNETIHKIEQHLSGPIPEELLELWKVSFGGELDYNCTLFTKESRLRFHWINYSIHKATITLTCGVG